MPGLSKKVHKSNELVRFGFLDTPNWIIQIVEVVLICKCLYIKCLQIYAIGMRLAYTFGVKRKPKPEGNQMKHFIGMAGLHGYLPQTCSSYDTYADAVDSMADTHELGKNRRSQLKRDGYLELNLHRDGNEYIEITECECDTPEDHND